MELGAKAGRQIADVCVEGSCLRRTRHVKCSRAALGVFSGCRGDGEERMDG